MPKRNLNGFTLIEISIVLVVIGLLMAGIILAQSLLRASKVQTIIKDVATFQTAIGQFKQKYGEMPGDMADATNYWGTNPNCTTLGGVGTGTQTCNGNGDGEIASGSSPFEQFLVWQHLANGGFISGQYTGAGIAGVPASSLFCSPWVNCPGGSITQAQSYFLKYVTGSLGGNTAYWSQGPGTYLVVGNSNATSGGYPAYPLLTGAEALALDTKVDDGLPGQGVWKSAMPTGATGYISKCVVISGTTGPVPDGTASSEAEAVYYSTYGNIPTCSFEINLTF